MNKKRFLELKTGDKIIHKRYGLCVVDGEIKEFDAKTICPETTEGKSLLFADSGSQGNRLLEDSYRLCDEVK